MVDRERVDALLEVLDGELTQLRAAAAQDRGQLLTDSRGLRAVKYGFVVAIATAIDIAEHVIASERLRTPTSFADAFVVLQETGWLDTDLAGRMRSAAGFRNRLVPRYADIDDGIVVDMLHSTTSDLQAYRRRVAGQLSGPDEGT